MEKIHLLPLTDSEVVLLVWALTAVMAAHETPAFEREFRPEILNKKKKEAEDLLNKIKKTN